MKIQIIKNVKKLVVTQSEFKRIIEISRDDALAAVKQDGYALQYVDARLVTVEK